MLLRCVSMLAESPVYAPSRRCTPTPFHSSGDTNHVVPTDSWRPSFCSSASSAALRRVGEAGGSSDRLSCWLRAVRLPIAKHVQRMHQIVSLDSPYSQGITDDMIHVLSTLHEQCPSGSRPSGSSDQRIRLATDSIARRIDAVQPDSPARGKYARFQ